MPGVNYLVFKISLNVIGQFWTLPHSQLEKDMHIYAAINIFSYLHIFHFFPLKWFLLFYNFFISQ